MKTDTYLGKKIKKLLLEKGIENPFTGFAMEADWLLASGRSFDIQSSVSDILTTLGLDLSDESMRDTPMRVANMLTQETFRGLDYSNFPKVLVLPNKMKFNSMLVEHGISVNSTCEHHLLPIVGIAAVGYIPNKFVIGLSKLNRIVDFFCRRPQIQERLTLQIHETLKYVLKTDDIAVYIDSTHHCVRARGIQDTDASTATSLLTGAFLEDSSTRSEFMHLARTRK